MIGMNNKSSKAKIPFLVIQGSNEYTQKTHSGCMAIMNDEINAIKDLFIYNDMKEKNIKPNYDQIPFWGYTPDEKEYIYPEYYDYDIYGYSNIKRTIVEWQINKYYAQGYKRPFAQLILVENSKHKPHDYNDVLAWNFFKGFRRLRNGILVEN